jgi:hypothetical protein
MDPIGDLSDLKKAQLLLIDLQCYGNLTPRQRNKIMHHVQEIETYLKEKTAKAIKSEFATKPIKLFPRLCDTPEKNHEKYERLKQRKAS